VCSSDLGNFGNFKSETILPNPTPQKQEGNSTI
jgi:hypothetical protein